MENTETGYSRNLKIVFLNLSKLVPESVGKFPVTIVRHGKMDHQVSVR